MGDESSDMKMEGESSDMKTVEENSDKRMVEESSKAEMAEQSSDAKMEGEGPVEDVGPEEEQEVERADEDGTPALKRLSVYGRAVFLLVAIVASLGIIYLFVWERLVPLRDFLLAAAFGAYVYLVFRMTYSEDSEKEYFAIAPDTRVLRLMIPISAALSIASPSYALFVVEDEIERAILARPLFWFFVERMLEWCTNRPSVSFFTRILSVYVIQIYRLAVIYEWFLLTADSNGWMQLLAGANLAYWATAILGYGVMYVGGKYVDDRKSISDLESLVSF